MANNYELEIQAQPSIYAPKQRTLKIYFSEPEKGVDKQTGVILLAAGYSGNANSNVFKKMRNNFADEYNALVVQCDYFGYQFMQDDYEVEITQEELEKRLTPAEKELLFRNYDKYKHLLHGKIFEQKIELGESESDFNDMGLIQAMDNLRALKVVLDIAKDNGYQLRSDRIYAYGFSHGAYLAYLCNALCPNLFRAIIDNSSYLVPRYLEKDRRFGVLSDGINVTQIFSYRAKDYVTDKEIYDLRKIYSQFENKSRIICFAGEEDHMTSLEDKKAFLNKVENSVVETVTKKRVDMSRFKNCEHGLGADFIELFKYTYAAHIEPVEKQNLRKKCEPIEFSDMSLKTELYEYQVSWESGIPVLYRIANA